MCTYDHKISYVFMGSVNICSLYTPQIPIDFHTRVRMPPTHGKEFIIFEHPFVVWRPNLANLECPYMITGFMEDLWWIYDGFMEDCRNRRTHEVPFIVACSHFTRKNTRFCAPASSTTQSPCNIMQPFQCDLAPQRQETHRTTHTGTTILAKHIYRRNQTTPAATAAHTRYLSSPAAATLHEKTHGFVLQLPPHNTRHVTSCSHSNAICNHNFKNA